MKKNKIIQLIIFLAGLVILFLGGMGLASASHTELRFPIDNSYSWKIDGNNLINNLNAVYPKTGQAEWMTSLNVIYSNPQVGSLWSSPNVLGVFNIYSLSQVQAAAHANELPLDPYAGKYYVLVKNDSSQVYDIVYKTSSNSARYVFWPNGDQKLAMNFDRSTPSADHWYADYLSQTMGYIQTNHPKLASGSPPPVSAGTSSGTGATTGTSSGSSGCTDSSGCETPSPPTPAEANSDDKSVSETLKQSNITTAWGLSLDVVNVLAIFILLAIAFANILHLDPEAWNFKRMIPALVIGLIAANLSHLICRAIIDFAGMLMNFFVPKQLAAQMVYNIYIGMFGGWTGAGAAAGTASILGIGAIVLFFTPVTNVLGCVLLVIAVIILGIPALITLILWLMLIARTYILWFLVILSPIAFFGMFFDPLKKIISTWWNWFLAWTFMGPIAYFFIYLADGFARDTSMNNTATGCFDTSSNQVGGIAKFLMVNVLLLLAVVVPYVIGQKIGMGLWAGIGKWLGKYPALGGARLGLAGVEAAGKKLGWKPLERLGKNVRSATYLPEAMFGREGLLGDINKANVGEVKTDLKTTARSGLLGRTGLMDNVIQGDMLSGRENVNRWSATGLVNWMNLGVEKGDRKKMAEGYNWLGAMAVSEDVPIEERRKAIEALDALGYSPEEVNSEVKVGNIIQRVEASGGLEKYRDRNRVWNWRAIKAVRRPQANAQNPDMLQARPVQVLDPNNVSAGNVASPPPPARGTPPGTPPPLPRAPGPPPVPPP